MATRRYYSAYAFCVCMAMGVQICRGVRDDSELVMVADALTLPAVGCSATEWCPSGMYCDQGNCATQGEEGAVCVEVSGNQYTWKNRPCKESLYCNRDTGDSSGTCAIRVEKGADCKPAIIDMCKEPFTCDEGTKVCALQCSATEPCPGGDEYCDDEGRCKTHLEGAECIRGQAMCGYNFWCYEGFCEPRLGKGKKCDPGHPDDPWAIVEDPCLEPYICTGEENEEICGVAGA